MKEESIWVAPIKLRIDLEPEIYDINADRDITFMRLAGDYEIEAAIVCIYKIACLVIM